MLHHGRRGILGKPASAETEAVAYLGTGFQLAPAVYKWSASGFGTKYANPVIDAVGVLQCKFSPDGKALAILTDTFPYIGAYAFDAVTGLGARYADPATSPPVAAGGDGCVTFSPAGDAIFFSQGGTPFIAAYAWNSTTGFGSKYANPITALGSRATGIRVSPDGTAIAMACSSSPRVAAYQWNSITGFGTKFANPVDDNTSGPQNNTTAFSPAGDALVVGGQSGAFADAWKFNSATGFGTKYANPSVALNTRPYNITFSLSGNAIIFGGGSAGNPYIAAYQWTSATGFGTRYANPTNVDSGTYGSFVPCAVLNALGDTIFFGGRATPFINAYQWSDATGFGTKYANPTSLPTSNALSIDFRKIPI